MSAKFSKRECEEICKLLKSASDLIYSGYVNFEKEEQEKRMACINKLTDLECEFIEGYNFDRKEKE